jgi:ATP-dependent exoDNAse (exonuclease V) beta subunit
MTEFTSVQPEDWRERARAVDISRSCIVQAPAGSGKTELLIQRILSLLSVAEKPEEILSITFTRKAAGEMRLRLLNALERACDSQPPADAHAIETWQRARAVLARDQLKDWNLLQNPARLQLMTIDSFCAFLTRRMPWLSRFGEQPMVNDDPAELYLKAAESLLSQLEQGGPGQKSIEALLVHLDNRMALLRDLLVAMLSKRDQWLRHLIAQQEQKPRQVLEAGLSLYVESFLSQVHSTIGNDIYRELRELGAYAAGNLEEPYSNNPLTTLLHEEEDQYSSRQWLAFAHLILTAKGEVRKGVNKTLGFPADKNALAQEMKSRAHNLLEKFHGNPVIAGALQLVRQLPETSYNPEQWQILKALLVLLPLAVVALREAFRQKGQVDFIEVAGAAHAAIGTAEAPEELLLQLDSRIQHILVDEFQDTSYAQYDLLRCLTAGWTPGDSRTVFVVGDPMQSIYRFREAEVGLYLRVCQRGLDHLPMERIVLSTNFRSGKGLVDWTNGTFSSLFPATEDEVRGAVRFSPAIAFDQADAAINISIHSFIGRQDQREADTVVNLVRQATKEEGASVAVLVRSKSHLTAIAEALKNADIRFQAQDVDPLVDRPVVRDILALTRALCYPADRVAWLSVLRAPWCGLLLEDLLHICGKDAKSTVWELLTRPSQQTEMFDQVSADGKQRLARIMPVLERALNNRGRFSLRHLVESTWLALYGPACIDESALQDVEQVFALFEDFDHATNPGEIEKQLGKLFAAPDPQAGPKVQLMTIHKSKGLEFDTVIIPGLGRGIRGRERSLLRWLEHPDYELLLAPIPPLLSDVREPTYQAIGHILQEKDDFETVRLLYVAATRARSQLHLLGHIKRDSKDELVPLSGSLLSVLWPVCGSIFTAKASQEEDLDELKSQTLKLKRLPTPWQPSYATESLPIAEDVIRLASGSGHYVEETLRSRRTEEGRVVGTLVHNWLERIAAEGVAHWSRSALERQLVNFKRQLNLNGVPAARVDSCAKRVLACLINTILSQRGQWLLGAHQEAASELALNGMVESQLVRATLDRTFVDSDGTRWIVDYKTSSPAQGEDESLFMSREADRYRDQMSLYAALVRQMEPQRPVRLALYFPTFDGWFELNP